MDKQQELEAAGEVGGVVVKVVIAGAGFLTAGPVGAWGAMLASELVGTVIPNLRRNRVEKLILELSNRVSHLEQVELRTRFLQPEFIDLFEDGCVQASRALDDERIEQLATFLQSSLTDEQIKYALNKRLLTLLGELNQIEIILLQSYAEHNRGNDEFCEKHSEIFEYNNLAVNAPEDDKNQKRVIDSYRNRLVSLGLIGRNHSSFPSLYLTILGSELLKKIGVEDVNAYAQGKVIGPFDALEAHEEWMRNIRAL